MRINIIQPNIFEIHGKKTLVQTPTSSLIVSNQCLRVRVRVFELIPSNVFLTFFSCQRKVIRKNLCIRKYISLDVIGRIYWLKEEFCPRF